MSMPKFKYEEFLENKEEIVSKYDYIIIENMIPNKKPNVEYMIIKNEKDLEKFKAIYYKEMSNPMFLNVCNIGCIIAYEVEKFSEIFVQSTNFIFLESATFNGDSGLRYQSGGHIQYYFKNCHFLKGLTMQRVVTSMLTFMDCRFYGWVNFQSNNIEECSFISCKVENRITLNGLKSNRCILNNCNVKSMGMAYTRLEIAEIDNCTIAHDFDLSNG